MKGPALLRPVLLVHLFMDYTRRSRHPLHIAWPDDSGIASRVSMGYEAFVHDGDCFKATMRMLADAPRMIRRRKELWARIIEHQKRIDLSIQIVAREKVPNGESVTNHMGRSGLIDTEHFFVDRCCRSHDYLLRHPSSTSERKRTYSRSITIRSADHLLPPVARRAAAMPITKR